MAILNGKVYAQGEVVEITPALPAPVFLTDVLVDRVRLRCLGVRVELGFPASTSPSSTTPTAVVTSVKSVKSVEDGRKPRRTKRASSKPQR